MIYKCNECGMLRSTQRCTTCELFTLRTKLS